MAADFASRCHLRASVPRGAGLLSSAERDRLIGGLLEIAQRGGRLRDHASRPISSEQEMQAFGQPRARAVLGKRGCVTRPHENEHFTAPHCRSPTGRGPAKDPVHAIPAPWRRTGRSRAEVSAVRPFTPRLTVGPPGRKKGLGPQSLSAEADDSPPLWPVGAAASMSELTAREKEILRAPAEGSLAAISASGFHPPARQRDHIQGILHEVDATSSPPSSPSPTRTPDRRSPESPPSPCFDQTQCGEPPAGMIPIMKARPGR